MVSDKVLSKALNHERCSLMEPGKRFTEGNRTLSLQFNTYFFMHYTELHFEDAVRPEKLAELVNQLE